MDDNEFDEKEINDQAADESKESDGYEVGYGKPPKRTRFRKGVSGNPTGRPKKTLSFGEALLREARTLMTITENGRQIRISKNSVLAKQLYKLAITGKTSAARLLLLHYQDAEVKAAQVEASRFKDASRSSARDFSEEELWEFIRVEAAKQKEEQRKEKKPN